MAKQITSIVEIAVSNCTFDDGFSFTYGAKKKPNAKERMVAKNIHYNILPIANFLGIPENPEDFKRKYENVASYLECIMKKTLLNPEITELLHHISDYLPEKKDPFNHGSEVNNQGLPYGDTNDDANGYLDNPLPIAMPMIMPIPEPHHEPVIMDNGPHLPFIPFAQPSIRQPGPNDKPMNQRPEPIAMPMHHQPISMPMSTEEESFYQPMPFAMPFEAMPMMMNMDHDGN